MVNFDPNISIITKYLEYRHQDKIKVEYRDLISNYNLFLVCIVCVRISFVFIVVVGLCELDLQPTSPSLVSLSKLTYIIDSRTSVVS